MKLYDYERAPSPRRVRVFLAEKGIDIERVPVDLMKSEQLQAQYLELNPRGVVPLLQLDDGRCIDEGVAICRYFEEVQPNPPLMGTDPVSKALVESWVRHADFDGFLSVADVLRNSNPAFADRGLPGVTESVPAIPALAERGQGGITRFFQRLEKRLAESPYLAGNDFSLADISAMCVVDFAKWVKREVPETHQHTLAWYAKVSQRPSAKA